MISSIPHMECLITCKIKRRLHEKIILKPFAKDRIPHIIPTILHIDTQRFWFCLAHYSRILMSATHRHESTNCSINAREHIWTIPCCSKSCNSSATCTCDRTIIRIRGDIDGLTIFSFECAHLRQHLLLNKLRPIIIGRVKLLATIIANNIPVFIIHHTWIDEHTYRHRHFTRSYKII